MSTIRERETYKPEQDPNAALALVSARPNEGPNTKQASTSAKDEDSDSDLIRAKDLVALDSTFNAAHQDGTDKELNDAREAVQRVLRTL